MSDFRKFCVAFSVAVTVAGIIGMGTGKYSIEANVALSMIWAAAFVAIAGRTAK